MLISVGLKEAWQAESCGFSTSPCNARGRWRHSFPYMFTVQPTNTLQTTAICLSSPQHFSSWSCDEKDTCGHFTHGSHNVYTAKAHGKHMVGLCDAIGMLNFLLYFMLGHLPLSGIRKTLEGQVKPASLNVSFWEQAAGKGGRPLLPADWLPGSLWLATVGYRTQDQTVLWSKGVVMF